MIAAEVGNRLEVRLELAGQPDQLDVATCLAFEGPARLDLVQLTVNVGLEEHRRMIARCPVARQSGSEGPSIRIRIRDRVVAIVFCVIDAGKRYV